MKISLGRLSLGKLSIAAVLACGLSFPTAATAGVTPSVTHPACNIHGRPWIDDAKAPRPDCTPIANNPWVENF